LLETFSPDALRIYMGMHHYRKPWSHNLHDLNQASALDYEIRKALTVESGVNGSVDPAPRKASFYQALEDDLDTPQALGVMQELVKEILNGSRSNKDIRKAQNFLRACGAVFGLRMGKSEPDPEVIHGWNRHLARFQV